MDRNIRRVLFTALVAGGLVVVGASSAHATEEDLLDPVAQGVATETGVDVPADDVDAGADDGLVGDIVGREGVLDSLVRGDVGGVVDGALGEDGLVRDLLEDVPPIDIGVPEPETPGTGEPGTDEPGTDTGTDGPGVTDPEPVDPGAGEPGPNEPGTDEPGADEPGADEPGTDEPGTDDPGTDDPGSHDPGTDGSGGARPETGVTGTPGIDSRPRPGGVAPGGPTPHGVTPADPGTQGPTAGSGSGAAESDRESGQGATATASEAVGELPDGSVDIGWGGAKEAVVPSYDGTILSGGLSEDFQITLTGPMAEAEPVDTPGETSARTGHTITGQLSLISLLLGLGIAALRMRRR